MGGGLKGINRDKRKYYTSLNSCKVPPLLKEAWKRSVVISVARDNSGSECNNKIVKETDTTDGGSVKPYSPSGM